MEVGHMWRDKILTHIFNLQPQTEKTPAENYVQLEGMHFNEFKKKKV
jgi:hypothetical protein